MKRETGTARRYAQALFEVALARDAIDQWATELGRIAELAQDPGAAKLLSTPGMPAAVRRRAVDAIAGPFSPEIERLLDLLLERKRTELLTSLSEAYADRVREHRGILRAAITTAVPLDDQERELIAQRLQRRFGKVIEIHSEVDPEILGGVVARVGDQLLDGSVRGGLERLRRRLTADY